MTNLFRLTPILVVSLCACVSLASAQTFDPRSEARVHAGAFHLTPSVSLKELGIDTNVFNTAVETRDFTFTVSPHVDLWVPLARRGLLTTSVTTDVIYYQTYASERSFNRDIRVRGDLFLNRVGLFAEPSYLNSRQRLNYEIDARARREERGLRTGVNVRASSKLSFEAVVGRGDTTFDGEAVFNGSLLQETLNRRNEWASLAIRHEVTPFTTFVVRGDTSRDRFDFSPERDTNSIRVTPGIELKPRALISGTAYVGFRRFTALNPSMPNFTGPVATVGLTYTLKSTTRFNFTGDRDVAYSYERLQPYYVVDSYGLSVRRQLVGLLDVQVGGQRHQYRYRDLLVPEVTPTAAPRVDVTRTWISTLGFRLGPGTRFGVGATYRQRESSSSRFRDYDGLRFITTLDYGIQP